VAPQAVELQRNAKKIDRAKVRMLRDKGMPMPDIAKTQGVHTSTIWRFLNQVDPHNEALKAFRDTKAETFELIQGKGLDVIDRVLDSFTDSNLAQLSWNQKTTLVGTMTTLVGVAFDKHRLQTGQATSITADALKLDRAKYGPIIDVTPTTTHVDNQAEQGNE
jgi:hypothetical protein